MGSEYHNRLDAQHRDGHIETACAHAHTALLTGGKPVAGCYLRLGWECNGYFARFVTFTGNSNNPVSNRRLRFIDISHCQTRTTPLASAAREIPTPYRKKSGQEDPARSGELTSGRV
jgi:hypothetical protein